MFCKAIILILMAVAVNRASARTDIWWWTALRYDNVQSVKALLEEGEDVNALIDMSSGDAYPLNLAARIGSLKVGKYLISKGARINQSTPNGFTPLLEACRNLEIEFLELLLQNGADISATTTDPPGYDALFLATLDFLKWKDSFTLTYYPDEALEKSNAYDAILNILFDHCFDFKKFGEVSATRLENEGFPDEAARIFEFVNKPAPSC